MAKSKIGTEVSKKEKEKIIPKRNSEAPASGLYKKKE